MIPQSAKFLTTACPKPAVPLEDCQKEYDRVILSDSPQRHMLHRAVVVPILLYCAETRILYRQQIRLPERFQQRCLRSMLGIKWQDYVSNEEVLKRASLPSTESILLQKQLRFFGHVTSMEDVRMPKAVFISDLQEGKCDRGAPRLCYKERLKRQPAPV